MIIFADLIALTYGILSQRSHSRSVSYTSFGRDIRVARMCAGMHDARTYTSGRPIYTRMQTVRCIDTHILSTTRTLPHAQLQMHVWQR